MFGLSLLLVPLTSHAQVQDDTIQLGDLVKSESSSAVYYYYANRYAFPNEDVYFSWYDVFLM